MSDKFKGDRYMYENLDLFSGVPQQPVISVPAIPQKPPIETAEGSGSVVKESLMPKTFALNVTPAPVYKTPDVSKTTTAQKALQIPQAFSMARPTRKAAQQASAAAIVRRTAEKPPQPTDDDVSYAIDPLTTDLDDD